MLMQKYAHQAWVNEKNNNNNYVSKADSTAPPTNRERLNDGQQQDLSQQSKQQRRHTYGSALSQIGKDTQDSKDKESIINENGVSNPSK